MHRALHVAFELLWAWLMMPAAFAQTPPAAPPPVPDGPRYIVAYVDVRPAESVSAVKAMQAMRDQAARAQGNMRSEALQRFGQLNQFVLLTVWKDQAAADAHAKASATAKLIAEVKRIQIAPIDERTHFALSVGPVDTKAPASAMAVVTHVDVIPPQRENGTVFTKQLADLSRKDDGNLRFEAVTQTNRQNHFTLIEIWRDRKTADAHLVAGHTRAFREKLAPATGALLDERLYRLLP
jgi:quinol monooxygenase YgiN